VGFIPDRPFLYEKLTGLEFMSFMADLYRLNGQSRDERIQAIPGALRACGVGAGAGRELLPRHEAEADHERCSPHGPRALIVDETDGGWTPEAPGSSRAFSRNSEKRAHRVHVQPTRWLLPKSSAIGSASSTREDSWRRTIAELRELAGQEDSPWSRCSCDLPVPGPDGRGGDRFSLRTTDSHARPYSPCPRLVGAQDMFVVSAVDAPWSRGLLLAITSDSGWASSSSFTGSSLLQGVEELGDLLAYKLLSMVFLTFFGLLVFSNILVALSTFFLSRDLGTIHATPVSMAETLRGENLWRPFSKAPGWCSSSESPSSRLRADLRRCSRLLPRAWSVSLCLPHYRRGLGVTVTIAPRPAPAGAADPRHPLSPLRASRRAPLLPLPVHAAGAPGRP